MDLIWVGGEGKYFCKQDWTASISLIRFNKLNSPRRPAGVFGWQSLQCESRLFAR
jgi:hypothetical protein